MDKMWMETISFVETISMVEMISFVFPMADPVHVCIRPKDAKEKLSIWRKIVLKRPTILFFTDNLAVYIPYLIMILCFLAPIMILSAPFSTQIFWYHQNWIRVQTINGCLAPKLEQINFLRDLDIGSILIIALLIQWAANGVLQNKRTESHPLPPLHPLHTKTGTLCKRKIKFQSQDYNMDFTLGF